MNNEVYKRLKKRLDTYIDSYPSPTNKENFSNFRKLKELTGREAKKLRDKIIISNGAFGMQYAIRYCRIINDNNAIEDVFQQSQLGIIEAVDRYDPDWISPKTGKGVNFTTFAYHYVRKCIVDYIKKNKLVVAPRDVAKNIKIVSEALDILFTENSGGPIYALDIQVKVKELKDILIEERIIEEILILIDLNSTATSDTFIMGSINEISVDTHNQESHIMLKAILMKDLGEIDKEIMEIIEMRFGINHPRPYSLSEIKLIKKLSDDDIELIKYKTRTFLNNK